MRKYLFPILCFITVASVAVPALAQQPDEDYGKPAIKATPTYVDGVVQGCKVGGCGCVITMDPCPEQYGPTSGQATAVPNSETVITTDLYHASAQGSGMPAGYQNVTGIVYSKTGRNILEDFTMCFPDYHIYPN